MSGYRKLCLLLMMQGLLSACASLESSDIPQHVLVPVYFMTDRNILPDEFSPAIFGEDRGEFVQGITQVALTTRRNTESQLADPARWQAYQAERNRDEMLSTDILDSEDFFEAVFSGNPSPPEADSVVLYIHGYNRSYESAVLDTADLIYEINLQSPLILYSWPSAGSILAYASDLVNVDWSTFYLNELLLNLLDLQDISKIHILAHSMGNRALLNSLKYLSDSGQIVDIDKIGQVVMLAPDIDTEIFARDYLPILRDLAEGITLYANAKDVPLQTSNRVNRYQRLGNARETVFTAPGMETVEISETVSIFNSHDAHLEIPQVQEDLHRLLNLQQMAPSRTTLSEVRDAANKPYWMLLNP